ncbi:helix-turn-helix domain-containing protein [Aquimarina sp. AU119]|uniref:helix-turn-helix domain-containing protein n=1 Tax=Aquimarina sp. AU119 TaxID=2108528 RepID=UPI000D68FD39|nr:helix-turn-helix domain-containing protein [Aquimarina sp. AU119]
MIKFLNIISCFLIAILLFSYIQIDKNNFLNVEAINEFNIPDSLRAKPYKYIEEQLYKYDNFENRVTIYAKSYIKKGVIDKNSLEMAKGYFFLSSVSQDSLELIYLNHAINLLKAKTNKNYPAILYYSKGDYYYKRANYKDALDNYFISYRIAKKHHNNVLAYDSKFNIGSLKNRIGKHGEALKIFKEFNDYILSEESEYPKDYYSKLIGLFALSDSYTKLKKLDTATTINKKGIKISLSNNDNDMYHYFIMNEGVNLYHKKEYKNSIDSLKKAIPNLIKLEDKSNEIFSRFYLGKSLFAESKIEDANFQFRTADSLFKDFKDLFPEIRQGYKILINYYKENNNKEKQLLYLNRLITVDSTLSSNYLYINNKIVKDFDTANLILDKERLINDLSQSNSSKSRSIISLAIVLIIVFILLVLNYKKRKRDKIRFKQLVKKNNKEEKNYKPLKDKQSLAHLSEDIIEIIKTGLDKFESEEEYLTPNISINTLAKSINSNSKYLSVFINHYEQKKFTDYINDLRIEYSIEKLKNDHKFRKYTIKAIADTVGFSNPVSFSQAFYKKTGIKPSYFIKKLENEAKT